MIEDLIIAGRKVIVLGDFNQAKDESVKFFKLFGMKQLEIGET